MTSDTLYILAIFDKLSRYYNKEIKFEMLLRGCKTSPGYNAVIGAFSRAGKWDLALRMLALKELSGYPVSWTE